MYNYWILLALLYLGMLPPLPPCNLLEIIARVSQEMFSSSS